MIPAACPCCDVNKLPHREYCTLYTDAPGMAADFDAVACLRLTDPEREAIARLMQDYQSAGLALDATVAATLRGLLEKHIGGER